LASQALTPIAPNQGRECLSTPNGRRPSQRLPSMRVWRRSGLIEQRWPSFRPWASPDLQPSSVHHDIRATKNKLGRSGAPGAARGHGSVPGQRDPTRMTAAPDQPAGLSDWYSLCQISAFQMRIKMVYKCLHIIVHCRRSRVLT
jgi:hypothetical protein